MVRNYSSGLTVHDIYSAVVRHKWKALTFFLLVMVSVTVVTLFSSKVYRSEGAVLVRLGRENTTLDPTAMIGQDLEVSVPFSREDEINSVAEVLMSRRLIEETVDTLGPAVVLNQDGANSTAEANGPGLIVRAVKSCVGAGRSLLGSFNPLPSPHLSDRDKAIIAMRDSLAVWPVRKSSVIRLTYEGRNPQAAQTVLQELIDSYHDLHESINRPPGTHEFLVAQTEQVHQELVTLEEQLRNLKSETGLVSPVEQRRTLIDRIAGIETNLSQVNAALASADAEVRTVREKLTDISPLREQSRVSGMPDQGTDNMRGQLYALEILAQEASSKYTEAHPRMQQIRQQLAEARENLADEKQSRIHVTTAPDKVYEQGRLALLAREPQLSSLKAKAEVLSGQLVDARAELQTLNDNELQIAALEREIQLHDEAYRKYSVNLEQARIDQALRHERLSNVAVVQPATREVLPIRPRKIVNLALGLFVAVTGSVGLALLLDYRDQPSRSPQSNGKSLGLPTLASISRIRKEQLDPNGSGKV